MEGKVEVKAGAIIGTLVLAGLLFIVVGCLFRPPSPSYQELTEINQRLSKENIYLQGRVSTYEEEGCK